MATSLTVEQLQRKTTAAEIEAKMLQVAGWIGLPVTSWKPGGLFRTLYHACAVVLETACEIPYYLAKSAFSETCEGDWLTLKCADDRNVFRIEATYATTDIVLDNAGGGLYTYAAGEYLVKHEDTGKVYKNVSAFTLNPLQTGLSVSVQALEAGTGSNAAANKITVPMVPVSAVTFTNPTSAIALDRETDAALRSRYIDALGARSIFGPDAAYRYWAKTCQRQDGSYIGVNRVWLSPGGVPVYVRVATPSGAVSGTADDPSTDLGAIQKVINEKVVPHPVTAIVSSATEVAVATTGTYYVDRAANLTDGEWQTLIGNAIDGYMQIVPIGGHVLPAATGKMYIEALSGAVKSASPYIVRPHITVPAADVALTSSEFPKGGAHTITIVQVDV